MLSPASNGSHGSPTNFNVAHDFPVSVESISAHDDDNAKETESSRCPRSLTRIYNGLRRHSDRSSSRSRSPHFTSSPNSSPSSTIEDQTHVLPDTVVEPLRISKNEENTNFERVHPEGRTLKVSSPHVNPIISRLENVEEQPASPFDAHFLSQLNSDKGFSSPLLQTTAFFPDNASDSYASEDELRRLTPVVSRQLRALSGPKYRPDPTDSDAGSSRPGSSELKSILLRSASRKRNERKSLLRTPSLMTSQSSSISSSLQANLRRPSSLLSRLARRTDQFSSQGSNLSSSPLVIPPRRSRPEARRRLSLSPRLAPIPESSLQEVSPRPLSGSESDSDRESLGIFELNGHDLLFDGCMSEDEEAREGGISPPTSVAPTDVDCEELGNHEEECQEQYEDETADASDRSCSCEYP